MTKRIILSRIAATPALMLIASLWAGGVMLLLGYVLVTVLGAFGIQGGNENINS